MNSQERDLLQRLENNEELSPSEILICRSLMKKETDKAFVEAVQSGSKRFIGSPCKNYHGPEHGHSRLRYTSMRGCVLCVNADALKRSGGDPEKNRLAAKQYRERNREAYRDYQREYQKKYRKTEKGRKYYSRKSKERYQKVKDDPDFKQKRNAKKREYYQKNRERLLAQKRAAYRRRRDAQKKEKQND